MAPALCPGERILVSPILVSPAGMQLFGIARGDVIVFRSRGAALVKRVAALPGERVSFRGEAVVVEPHGDMRWAEPAASFASSSDGACESAPRKAARVRPRGPDDPDRKSPREAIPLVLKSGEYFLLGDNQDRSADSRHFGAVSEDAMIGKAVLRLWPFRRFGRVDG